jgi:hypothetical protein
MSLNNIILVLIAINIILLIKVFYKKENFATTDEITITESIKNLGIIAKELIDEKKLTIPADLVIEKGNNIVFNTSKTNVKYKLYVNENDKLAINGDVVMDKVEMSNLTAAYSNLKQIFSNTIKVTSDSGIINSGVITCPTIKVNDNLNVIKNLEVNGTINAKEIVTSGNINAKGEIIADSDINARGGVNVSGDVNVAKNIFYCESIKNECYI